MDIRFFPGKSVRPTLLSLACIVGLSLASCADDDIASDTKGDRGTAVSFNVSDAQYDARQPAGAPTRAAFAESLAQQDLTPEDLTVQKLPVQGGDGNACLIETTVAGTNPVRPAGAPTRANITTTATLGNFSTTAYRGATAATIGTTPWFYNRETKPDGTLAQPVLWAFDQPFARFFAVSPQVTDGYAKLVLSPESHGGTPYVDFEAETDVKKQKDLMTACSGLVHYATQYVAPTANLAFRHALTAVRFKVGQNLSWNKTITKVEIRNAMSRGRYTPSTLADGTGAAWSNVNTPATFTLSGLNVSTHEDVNTILTGKDNDNYTFYMIPQPLSGVSVCVEFSDGSQINANLSGTWKPGTTKTYALSENNSTWEYQLAVTGPATAANDATTVGYTVQSYRRDPSTGVQQPVKWKVMGYDANGDGTFSMDEQPVWLTGLSKTEGEGGTTAEAGTATLQAASLIDLLAARNEAMKSAPALGTATTPYDLSTKGGSATRSTANCYVISAPGYYRIPLVYGNAIKDGQKNEQAYKTSHSGNNILSNFKDHAGNDITDPWITQSNGGVNIPDGAKLVWADESGLVTNLSVTGSGTDAFVKFEVPAAAIKNGNAVIAATKGGTVVWSWHLWFAPQEVLQTIACTNYSGKTYSFANETLGMKYTNWQGTSYSAPRSVRVMVEQTAGQAEKQVGYFTITQNNANGVRQGYATFYQSGRKDAMPGIDNVYGTFSKNGGNSMSIKNGIQHPETFYTYGTTWTNNYNYYNLWSMETTGIGQDIPVVKTVYDPCPAGFKMPGLTAFTFMTKSQTQTDGGNISGSWNNGYYFNNNVQNPDATLYFPACGLRNGKDGSLSGLNQAGRYWLSGCGRNSARSALYFDSGSVTPSASSTFSLGHSVRPVADN